jgi:protein TonB
MSTGPGVSSTVSAESRAPNFAGGAKVAAVFIAIAPWLAALVGTVQTFGLMKELESSPLERLAYWCLVAMTVACAYFVSRHLWRGVHDGSTAPLRLLLLSTLPFWLLSEAVGQFLAQYLLRSGNPWGYAEASMLRIAGEYTAWALTGSVAFGLSISAFLWRAPAQRLPGIVWAWASLAPIALFVAWIAGTAQVQAPELRASLLAYGWLSLPIVLGLAGAALGDAPRVHPRPDWILGVGLGALLVFVSAASMAMGYAMIESQTAEGGYGGAADSADAVARAGRVAWLGLPLAALPLVIFAARLQRWPAPAGWGMVVLPLALLAIALLIDASGPGAEHGLAEAYPRRLWLLVAYTVLVPLALFALRRVAGGPDATRDGLALAAALTGLMWLAWRPGLLLLLAPARARVPPAPVETGHPAPPPVETDWPPPPPPKAVALLPPIEGGVVGGKAEGVLGADAGIVEELPPMVEAAPTPPPPSEIIVNPGALQAMRTSGADVRPPPSMYSDRPRTTLALMLHVSAGGKVTRIEVMKASGNPELDAYVRSTVETWRFRPWTDQGRAVPVRTGMTFIFVNQR